MLGTAIDVFGGNLAIEAASPDWALTQELELHRLRPLREGEICVTGAALRAGRTNMVIETELHSKDDLAPHTVGSLTFTRVPRREGTTLEPEFPERTEFALPDSGLGDESIHAYLGVRERDAASGHVELPLEGRIRNSVGGLQGGVAIILAEASAMALARHAGLPATVIDLSCRYLSLGRTGPIEARAKVLRAHPEHALLRVELHDAGEPDRRVAVVMVGTGRLG